MTDEAALAIEALRQKDFAAASRHIAAYEAKYPLALKHYQIKGLAALALRDWGVAQATFAAAAQKFPDQPLLWFNLGLACENLGAVEAAINQYRQSLTLDPLQGEAAGNLSNLYRHMRQFDEAENFARQALAANADKAQALNMLALAFGRQGKFAAAEQALTAALELAPQDAALLANRANLAVDQLKFDEAWGFFTAARAIDDTPAIRKDEAMARLLAGDASGWPLYEARLELPNALRLRPDFPRWQGENLSGKKLLLVAEQGFGDTIQFCRYGKLLAAMGADLVWMVQKPLQGLLAANLPGQVLSEADAMPKVDFWSPLMSLPWLLTLPQVDAPYLIVPAKHEKTARRKIGLVWAGSPTHERDHERSIPLHMFMPLFQRIDADYIAPFTGKALDQITAETPVAKPDRPLNDFTDTAALLIKLDALVTVDTATAHLAGALGVKTYLLLPHCPDWRWGVSFETTLWYGSVTLLRQSCYGDWGGVITGLITKLV